MLPTTQQKGTMKLHWKKTCFENIHLFWWNVFFVFFWFWQICKTKLQPSDFCWEDGIHRKSFCPNFFAKPRCAAYGWMLRNGDTNWSTAGQGSWWNGWYGLSPIIGTCFLYVRLLSIVYYNYILSEYRYLYYIEYIICNLSYIIYSVQNSYILLF